jgi:hypothetical protein
MTSIKSSIFLVAKQLHRAMVEKPPPTNRNQKKLQNPNSHLTRKRKKRNLMKKRRKKRNLRKKRRKMTNLRKKRRKMTNLRKKRRKMTNLRKKRRKKANLRKKKRKRKIRKLLLRGKVVLQQTNFLGASRQ